MRASEIHDGDRGLVGHARVVGRHAARRADWEKEDGTTTKFRCRDGENRREGFRKKLGSLDGRDVLSSTTKINFEEKKFSA